MLTSKFDLYKSEWLDLVFADRNKAYGAYELRQHYDRTIAKAMGLTFMSIGLICLAAIVSTRPQTVAHVAPQDTVVTVVALHPHIDPPAPARRVSPPVKPPAPVKTTAFNAFVVTRDDEIKTPAPDVTKIQGAIGPVTIDGPVGPPNVPVDTKTAPGTGKTSAAPDVIYPPAGLESMPTPIGGETAWAKFLNKNLRFPQEAQEVGASGRVYMSFVVEKDGSLSDITVVRGAGYGFDEEATRVLKLARPWKPGIQNGQPVRVKFVIPINFQIGDQ